MILYINDNYEGDKEGKYGATPSISNSEDEDRPKLVPPKIFLSSAEGSNKKGADAEPDNDDNIHLSPDRQDQQGLSDFDILMDLSYKHSLMTYV